MTGVGTDHREWSGAGQALERATDPAGLPASGGEGGPGISRPSTPGGWRHVPALDGLRGLAVAGVLVYHAGHLEGGYLGVDLFFTLSGFLITSLLLREVASTGGVSLVSFWLRRARRLLPAVVGLVAAVSAFAWFWTTPTGQRGVRGDAIATLLYVANWRAVASEQGYWDQYAVPSPFQHTWSLAIEEQFYLVWPLVVVGLAVLARRRGWSLPRVVLPVAVAGAAASYGVMFLLYEPGQDASRAYFGTDTRIGGILVGVALAALLEIRSAPAPAHVRPRRSSRGRLLELTAALGVAWLAWAWWTLEGQRSGPYRGGFLVCALAAVTIIAACLRRPDGPVARVLSLRPLRFLGVVSYGLYLWHWPIFVALRLEQRQLGLSDGGLFAAQIGLSLVAAVASYRLIEQPIRLGGLAGWGRSGRRLMPAAAVLAVGGLIVVTTVRAEDRPTEVRVDAVAFEPAPIVTPDPAPAVAGRAAPPPLEAGPQLRPADRAPRLLVVGDSVGIDFGQGIGADPELQVDVVSRAQVACKMSPLPHRWRIDGVELDMEQEHCPPQHPLWEEVLERFDPDAVLAGYGGAFMGEVLLEDQWVAPCSELFNRYWLDYSIQAIDLLASRGATVWVVLPPDPVLAYLDGRILDTMTCLRDIYADAVAARPQLARTIDLQELVCPDRECRIEIDGIELRPDGLHFMEGGRSFISRWLVEQMWEPPPG